MQIQPPVAGPPIDIDVPITDEIKLTKILYFRSDNEADEGAHEVVFQVESEGRTGLLYWYQVWHKRDIDQETLLCDTPEIFEDVDLPAEWTDGVWDCRRQDHDWDKPIGEDPGYNIREWVPVVVEI